MSFVNKLDYDEVRSGFLVKASIKKAWERQLEIWRAVDALCRKHAITYWASDATLLGAVRHKGFIPWYDKFDLCMMRPDFNRFCRIFTEESRFGGVLEVRFKHFTRLIISHAQTTLLTKDDLANPQGAKGILIEVFALDASLDGSEQALFAANGINELLATVYNYPTIEKYLVDGNKPANELRVIEALHALDDKDKQLAFLEKYAEGLFDWSRTVNRVDKSADKPPKLKAWYRETIRLPFESVELPAPAEYDKILSGIYGDWRKCVYDQKSRLGVMHSADIPYREALTRLNREMILETIEKNELIHKKRLEEAAQ